MILSACIVSIRCHGKVRVGSCYMYTYTTEVKHTDIVKVDYNNYVLSQACGNAAQHMKWFKEASINMVKCMWEVITTEVKCTTNSDFDYIMPK